MRLFCSAAHSIEPIAQRGLDGLRLALFLELLRAPAVVLKDALAGERLLEPVEELCGRIDLVVMFAVGEDGHLVQVFGEPR